MLQKYVKWKRVKVSDNFYKDINTNDTFQNETKDSEFQETSYELNNYFLGIAKYPQDTPQDFIDGLLLKFSEFEVEFVSEEEANAFLSEVGGKDENWEQLLTVKDFKFTDNRPLDIIH